MSTNTILMDCNRGQAVDGDQTNAASTMQRRKHDALRYTIYHRTSDIVGHHPDMA